MSAWLFRVLSDTRFGLQSPAEAQHIILPVQKPPAARTSGLDSPTLLPQITEIHSSRSYRTSRVTSHMRPNPSVGNPNSVLQLQQSHPPHRASPTTTAGACCLWGSVVRKGHHSDSWQRQPCCFACLRRRLPAFNKLLQVSSRDSANNRKQINQQHCCRVRT